MEFATSIPNRMVRNRALTAPIVVKVTSSGSNTTQVTVDINDAWLYLSLVTADRTTSLAPPREDLLRGVRVDSIHPATSVANGPATTLGRATFSNIAISESGRYCFRVSMVRMPSQQRADNGTSAHVLPDLYSRSFDVVNA